jgi:hypothetical protein
LVNDQDQEITFPNKKERPVGVPAARGHGVMEVQTFEALGGGLEYILRVPFVSGEVDRPAGPFRPVRRYLRSGFAAFSPQNFVAVNQASQFPCRLNEAGGSARLSQAVTPRATSRDAIAAKNFPTDL